MPKIACALPTMKKVHQQLFMDVEANSVFYHDGFYSLQLADLFRELQGYGQDLFMRKLTMEGKAYLMLTMQIRLFQDDLEDAEQRSLLRQSEVKLIKKAESLIREEIATLGTIDIIAARVGLNGRKLREGFQYMYHQTVNSYIQKVRLQLARDLLPNLEYSISEIAELIGLSSKSYFSKIFKEEYGTTPSEYRQNCFHILKNGKKPQGN
jgi:AraC-like DNA-binding protein